MEVVRQGLVVLAPPQNGGMRAVERGLAKWRDIPWKSTVKACLFFLLFLLFLVSRSGRASIPMVEGRHAQQSNGGRVRSKEHPKIEG